MLEPEPAAAVQLAVLTDFDGTLVDIAETPDAVEVPSSLPKLLADAADELGSAFAVISGRTIADIDRFLAPGNFAVAGSHGIQRRRADGSLQPVDEKLIEGASRVAARLRPLVAANPMLLLETKDGAVALHYRRQPELAEACHQAIMEAIAEEDAFSLVAGKMVIEARPKGISKGTALRDFMHEAPFAGRTPVFIGDDTTDEDAFVAAQELGGVGIKLGTGDTAARLRIANIGSVHALIRGLGELAKQERSGTDQ